MQLKGNTINTSQYLVKTYKTNNILNFINFFHSHIHAFKIFVLLILFFDLALINRAGGLYGRILTEVVSTDRTQRGLYTRPRSRFSHTDRLSSVTKMLIIWQIQEKFNLFHVIGLYLLTFCLRTSMSRIYFFQSLLVLFTVFLFLISPLARTGVYIFR